MLSISAAVLATTGCTPSGIPDICCLEYIFFQLFIHSKSDVKGIVIKSCQASSSGLEVSVRKSTTSPMLPILPSFFALYKTYKISPTSNELALLAQWSLCLFSPGSVKISAITVAPFTSFTVPSSTSASGLYDTLPSKLYGLNLSIF